MTRLAIILCFLCAPVMADEPKPVTLVDPCAPDYKGDSACVEVIPNTMRSHVVSTGKMRCVITDGQTIADPKWSGILEREFYIECEPVTEEQP